MITVTNLRKIFTAQGVKGAGKWKREDFEMVIAEAHLAAIIADKHRDRTAKAAVAPAAPQKGICEDCGRKVGKSGHPTLCEACYNYAGWENTHNDDAHGDPSLAEQAESVADCPVCNPELDPRKAPKPGRSRAGMVIIAKGSEVHKSQIFKTAAEAAGWTVNVIDTLEGTTGEEDPRYSATATKGDESISLAWNGRAYDYNASSAVLKGKARKVRNLKEALRFL